MKKSIRTILAMLTLCITLCITAPKADAATSGNYTYTVFNGDDEVTVGLEYSFIDLHSGDTLLIGSDGIGDYMKFEKSADLIKQSPEEMINNSAEYDARPYAEYADDKTLIKLSFNK